MWIRNVNPMPVTDELPNGEDPKKVFGDAKPGLSYVPLTFMPGLISVMMLGARKYGKLNWRSTRVDPLTYLDAIWRHYEVLHGPEGVAAKDPESLRLHLEHIMANCSILIDLISRSQEPTDKTE